MDNPKTTQAHNTSLTGAVDFAYRFTDDGVKEIVSAAFKVLSNQDQAREFVARFRQDNPDVHLSDAQWTKLIDALATRA